MKKKGKRSTEYAGKLSKAEFEVFVQNEDFSCGAACLRMLEQWANGWSYGEEHWRTVAKTGTRIGGTYRDDMYEALETIDCIECELVTEKISHWLENANPPEIDENTVYLLEIDWYSRDAKNLGHWIIVVDIFDSKDKRPKALAYCANSVSGECEVWPWKSLLHNGVHSAFRVTRKRSAAAS